MLKSIAPLLFFIYNPLPIHIFCLTLHQKSEDSLRMKLKQQDYEAI